MGRDGMIVKALFTGIFTAAVWLPAIARADEAPKQEPAKPDEYYSSLDDTQVRRGIADLNSYYVAQPMQSESQSGDNSVQMPYLDPPGGSGGGYVSFSGPATSTFLADAPPEEQESLLDSVQFGVDWRPEINGTTDNARQRFGWDLPGSEIDSIGVRADVTALLRDEVKGDNQATAWRVTGMLGSTSLSLVPNAQAFSADSEGGGLLWDVGVGWSKGPMSLSAGYQSAYGRDATSDSLSAMAILSLGADYAVLPGLSLYGEFNLIDRTVDSTSQGLGTVVIVGTGVNF